jgi:hypothetical protein
VDAVGLSHIDLDALGGVLSILGKKPGPESFWALAGKVDVNGAHKLGVLGGSSEDVRRLHAWWAWSESNRCFPPRPKPGEVWPDGDPRWVAKVPDYILLAKHALERIMLKPGTFRCQACQQLYKGAESCRTEGHCDDCGCELPRLQHGPTEEAQAAMFAAGDEFRTKEDALNKSSCLGSLMGVLARESEAFVNHLYVSPPFKPGDVPPPSQAVVSYNPKTRAVTLSLAEPIPGVSCRDIAVALWGPEAGGHAGIAGGPRTGLPREEAVRAFAALVAAIAGRGRGEGEFGYDGAAACIWRLPKVS